MTQNGFKFKIYDQSKAYFITCTVVKWINLFEVDTYRDLLIDSLIYCQKNKGLNVFAYVIMPSHIHLLVRAENDDLSKIICDFKKYTSKKIIEQLHKDSDISGDAILKVFEFEASKHSRNKTYQVWIQNNHPIEVYSNKFIKQKVDYIHNNPVKAGLVDHPEDYLYSSARNYAEMGGVIDVIKVVLD
jgi:REP element-mobilizing transposase RayT